VSGVAGKFQHRDPPCSLELLAMGECMGGPRPSQHYCW
jgi:hypothetical protein